MPNTLWLETASADIFLPLKQMKFRWVLNIFPYIPFRLIEHANMYQLKSNTIHTGFLVYNKSLRCACPASLSKFDCSVLWATCLGGDIKISSYQHRAFHNVQKTVSWSHYFYHEEHVLWKAAFIFNQGPMGIMVTKCVPYTYWTGTLRIKLIISYWKVHWFHSLTIGCVVVT